MTGRCSEVKDDGKLFLGGSDLREQAKVEKLKSIDDFNKAQSAGGAEAAPVLERLRNVMFEMGIDKELFDQVVDGMKKDCSGLASNESELLSMVSEELGEWTRFWSGVDSAFVRPSCGSLLPLVLRIEQLVG